MEEFGLSVLEAMFCGIPVITTEFVGASEIIQDIGRDFIMPEANLEMLVSMILKLSDQDLVQKISSVNKKTSLQFEANSGRKNFERLLQKVHPKIF